jgi:intracellular sulfur oxidation DsrE/DsrF family protein
MFLIFNYKILAMLLKFKYSFLVLLSCVLFNQGYSQINEKQAKVHNIVIQLNSADTATWTSIVGNIKNIQKVWPNNLNIEVVVHGKALDFLIKDKTYHASDIQLLASQGVQFSACQNTMRKHNVTAEMLIKEAGTVPSGVAEVILKQEAGWSYLKP